MNYSPMSPRNNLSCELTKVITDRNMLSMRSRMRVLTAMNENSQKHAAERKKNLRYQAIQEILTTEVTYLRQLEILMEFFLLPIHEKQLLKHSTVTTLYDNIKTLYNISGELIKELKLDSENIAAAFHKLAPFFKLYSVYAYDYEQVLMILQASQENDQTLRNFIKCQETRPEVSRSLQSLLITPIQRVPRYKLLLKEVLQHTPSKHKEYGLLQVCLVEIEKAAAHINSLVAQNEEVQKLLKLQRCILNRINLVKPGRKLIKQGSLMRVSRRGNSAYRRYFVLLNDTLLYCKGEPECSLTVCCVLPLNKCKVECVLSGGLFRVTCLNETLLLYSEKDDSNSWIECMQNAIKKYSECRQTLRKDSSSRKPLRHHNVCLFPSENIPNKCVKRKRTDDDDEICLNSSSIVYLKKDNEDEIDSQEENKCLRLLKKFKKAKPDTILKEEKIGSSKDKLTLSSSHNFIEENHILASDNVTSSITDTTRKMDADYTEYRYTNPTSYGQGAQSVTSQLKNIGNFFVCMGNSIKELFRFR